MIGLCKFTLDHFVTIRVDYSAKFGPDAGTDSIGDWKQAEKMSAFLNKLDSGCSSQNDCL